MLFPPFLNTADEIRLVSPSGAIESRFIDSAAETIANAGYKAVVSEHARESYGRFSATMENRIADLQSALDDENIRAILCTRGGYGAVQLLEKLDFTRFVRNPKWIVGYSDITILHSAVNRLGIASLHAGMARQIAELGMQEESVKSIFSVLEGKIPTYNIAACSHNRCGTAAGRLAGGNLSVLFGLRGTPYDIDYEGKILFIEDIGERIYHIERMLYNLRLGGVFSKIKGLIIGHFTDCHEDETMQCTLSEIILDAVRDYEFPVCFGFPAGHETPNMPMIMGAEVCLKSETEFTELKWLK